MTRPIINLDELEYVRWDQRFSHRQPPPHERFGADVADVGRKIGAKKLGYNVTRIDPGKAAYPAHAHRINEEMFLVLEGEGELRVGEERFPVRRGDVIACPPGGPENAHQIINTGTVELKYLAVSTQLMPEICDYPDSGKFLVTERLRSADGTVSGFRHIGRPESALDYWEGE